jgi:epoxyqueuosine reductase
MIDLNKKSTLIKSFAQDAGFSFCGISKADFLEEEAKRLDQWLKKGFHGQMDYMANHFDKRLDPRLLIPGAKSVISLLFNYYTPKKQSIEESPKISKYAYGEDYHFVLKRKLKDILKKIRKEFGDIEGRVFVDSAPVMDKAWATKSGLGWMGKNTNLINKGHGSYFFIAEIIVDLELAYDGPTTDHCGSCTACIDSCPTDAIVAPYVVDGSKCISYFTIELKDEIPVEMRGKFDNWMYGCDVCQDVCPWNRFSKQHSEPAFDAKKELLEMSKQEWQELTEETFNIIFKKSAVKRTKHKGLKRNIRFLK